MTKILTQYQLWTALHDFTPLAGVGYAVRLLFQQPLYWVGLVRSSNVHRASFKLPVIHVHIKLWPVSVAHHNCESVDYIKLIPHF